MSRFGVVISDYHILMDEQSDFDSMFYKSSIKDAWLWDFSYYGTIDTFDRTQHR